MTGERLLFAAALLLACTAVHYESPRLAERQGERESLAVYREGPELEITGTLTAGPVHPDHQVRNETDASPFIQAELLPGEEELHAAAGFGVVFDQLQIDVRVDLSERRDTAFLSAIYSF